MKKMIVILTGAIAVTAAVTTAAVFRYVFCFSKKQRGMIGFPKGRQYQPYRESSEALMKRLKEIPFEEVQIHSDDGLRLWGR